MKDKQVKYPQLRFKGFTDPWEERKLGEVGKAKSGIGFPDAQQGGKQGTPFYKVSDMNNPGNEVVMMNANNYASDSQLKENKWNPINPQNSGVVFAKVGAAIFLDRKRIVDTSFLIDNNMMSYLFDSSWNRYFGKTLFEKLRLSRFAQVGALPSFNGSDVEDIKVMIPEESEQKVIGDMFEKLDDTIALHQRKLDLLKEQKKGYLQKMFPKNGAKVPELRFAGFADDWEQRKLGELGKIYTGNTPKTSDLDNWTDNKEGHIWITPTDIDKLIMSDSDRHLSEQGWSKARKIPENSVLITSIASIGKNTINAVPVAFNQQINAIVPEKNDSYFILSAMIKDTARFASVAGQTATAIINKTTFEKFQIATPSYEEQQKIGLFFKQLDNTITLHQHKLDLLKEQKKGFLQKMFV